MQLFIVKLILFFAIGCVPILIFGYFGSIISEDAAYIAVLIGFFIYTIAVIIYDIYSRYKINRRVKDLQPPPLDEFKRIVTNTDLEKSFAQMVANAENYTTAKTFVDSVVDEIYNLPLVFSDKMQRFTGIDGGERINKVKLDSKMFCLTKEEVVSYYGDRLYNEQEIDEVLECCRRLIVIMMLGKQGLIPSWFFDNNKGFAKSDYKLITKEWFDMANNLVAWINFQIIKNNKSFVHTEKNGMETPIIRAIGVMRSGNKTRYSKLAKYKFSIDAYIWDSMLEDNIDLE